MAMIEISKAVAVAAAASMVNATRFTGPVACARCYVVLAGGRISAATSRTLKSAGLLVTGRPGYSGKVIYVGYDNATGVEYGKALRLAQSLSDLGVDAYADADMD